MTESAQRAAFEAVYADFADAVFRYALRRTGNESDADDVVAETFAVCWRRWGDVPKGRELPWLYGVARKVLANQRRSTSRLERVRDALRSEPAVGPPSDPDADALRAALARLSPRDQEILRLSLWEDLTTDEIAAALGISENAVYIRLHRARLRFAAEYEQGGGQ